MYKAVDVIEVRIWGRTVGAVARDPALGFYAFEYDPAFVRSGIELAPLTMPLAAGREPFAFPSLPELTYMRLPGLLADALPDDFGNALQQTAMLIKARVGLEAATIDLGGWDSHLAQQTMLEPLMDRLARALRAFHRDLGVAISRTTIVVMTEFGRRVAENSSFGTDHGRGSVMFALGGGVRGGRVLGEWPGLGSDVLDGPGDLPVRTNYRNVLADRKSVV